MQPKVSAAGFGVCLLAALVLLGDLLGSSADSARAFTEQFDDAAARIGHVVGALALVVSSVGLVVFGLGFRRLLPGKLQTSTVDVIASLSVLSSAGFLVSASLLAAPALMRILGDFTDDPGIEPNAAAGIAQAGTVLLVFTLIVTGLMTILVIRLARQQFGMNRAFLAVGWFVSLLTLLGLAVSTLFPLAIYWIGLGIWMDTKRQQRAPSS